jgi:hypothetical protein
MKKRLYQIGKTNVIFSFSRKIINKFWLFDLKFKDNSCVYIEETEKEIIIHRKQENNTYKAKVYVSGLTCFIVFSKYIISNEKLENLRKNKIVNIIPDLPKNKITITLI